MRGLHVGAMGMDGPMRPLGNKGAHRLIQSAKGNTMSNPPLDGSMQFVPAGWLELAYWNRPMIVCSRTIPDPPQGRLSIDQPTK